MCLRARYRKCLAAGLVLMSAYTAWGTNVPVVWDGDTDIDWSNGQNWVGNAAPPADDHAKITGTFANQPTLLVPTTVGGVWITALTQDFGAVANDNILSIGGNTINGVSNVAVLFDNSPGFNAAINNKISIIGDGLIVRNDTDQTITFASATNAVGNGVINLNGNTLTFSNHGAGIIDVGNIFGTGGVTVDSPGTGIFVSGSNNTSFSGQLTIARGILQTNSVNNNAANGKLGNSALSVILGSSGNTGTLLYNAAGNQTSTKRFTLSTGGTGVFDMQQTAAVTLTLSGVIDGSGALEVKGNGTGTLLLSGANTYSGGTKLVSGRLSLGSSSTGSITNGPLGTGNLTLAGGTLATNGTRSIANPIVTAGSSTITPASGTLTLSGPLTSTSAMDQISIGVASSTVLISGDVGGFGGTFIRDSASSTLNFGANDVDASQAKFVMTGASSGVSRYLRFGDSAAGTTASIKMGDLSGGGVVNPAAGGMTEFNVSVGYLNEPNTEFSGAFLGRASQTFNLTKVGSGAWTLSGPSSYGGNIAPGTTTVSAGTLIAGGNVPAVTLTNIGFSTASGSDVLTCAIPHSLEINDQVSFQGTLAGGIVAVTTYHVVEVVSATEVKLSSTPGGAPIVFTASQSTETPPTIAQLTPFGSGSTAIVLGNANTGSSNVSLLTGGPFTIERGVTVTANGSGTASIGGNTIDSSTFSGSISLSKNVNLTSVATGGNAVNVTGVIASSGSFGVTKVGTGDVVLSAMNTYTGDTKVQEGTLSITNPFLADAADVYLSTGAVLDLNFSGTDTIRGLFFNNVAQATGTWGSAVSGADNVSSFFSGMGKLLVMPGLPGDFNSDGKVNAADYVLWRNDPSAYGGAGGYATWRANFGNPPGSGSSLDGAGAVPEPGAIVIALIGGLGLWGSRRRTGCAS